MNFQIYVQLQPTSLGSGDGNVDKDSDAALPMEVDRECGTQGVKESQVGMMDALFDALQMGLSSDVPVLSAHQPPNQVTSFHDNATKQTSSVLHDDVC